ncbi:MAG TPA: 1-acyl-sn-glycerol-3-phosphate acyltransferase [Blastocatellia bacterium]|nr:1-acyl-sn-glycerol-3-phosphate acyltransferase [Blastocatellia bacterium]
MSEFGASLAIPESGASTLDPDCGIRTVIYVPPLGPSIEMTPDLSDAAAVFDRCARNRAGHVILISSALIYGASHSNPGMIGELRPAQRNGANSIGCRWGDLESMASERLRGQRLTILRPAAVLRRGAEDYFSQLLGGRIAVTLPGYDPPLQLLAPQDLARAVRCAVERSTGGVYNVAPDSVIPLRKALQLAGARRTPVPRVIQLVARAALRPFGLARSISHLDFIRYSWTVSNAKIKRELSFAPRRSSAGAVVGINAKRSPFVPSMRFDEFGLDPGFLSLLGRMLFGFLEKRYWRIEVDGFEYLPREGGAVLVGVHRGFMPWDGIMMVHQIFQHTGRVPRFLMHPGLVKPPFAFNFMTKIGGIIACQENANYVLARGEMLGVFPEGVGGAFTLYRDAYRIGRFLRNDFVKMALRHRTPIVPFITVGSAEIFPILKKLDWPWWQKRMDWPCFPITPTFPLLPVPLPSKWHTQFLTPLHIERQYGPEAADDPGTVGAISDEVRVRMAAAMRAIVSRRRSIFYGSVFEEEAH